MSITRLLKIGTVVGIAIVLYLIFFPPSPVSAAINRPCADHQTGQMQSGSGTVPFNVVTCGGLKQPPAGMHWVAINDGSDNDWDANDVIIYNLAPNFNLLNVIVTCTSKYQWQTNPPGPTYGQTKWVTNTCGYYQRSKAYCNGPGGTHTTIRGGWVISDIWSQALCPSRFALNTAWIQIKACSSCSIGNTKQYWPTSNGNRYGKI